MQQYNYPAAEKILSDIESIIRKDAKLNLFEIIPVIKNENKSPIHYQERSLGLEGWCVPHLYCHAYSQILTIRKNKSSREDPGRVNRLLMGALIINPHISTFWNMRKEMMCRGKLDTQFELHLTAIILSHKPKSEDVFNHRKWIIRRLLKEGQRCEKVLRMELVVCEAAAERYGSNYPAWRHRGWAVREAGAAVQAAEVTWSRAWLERHVSDSTGLHYRASLLSSVIPLQEGLVWEELELLSGLMAVMPGHEALWVYRRCLLRLATTAPLPHHHHPALLRLTVAEHKFLNRTLSADTDPSTKLYLRRHVAWMRDVLKIPIDTLSSIDQ